MTMTSTAPTPEQFLIDPTYAEGEELDPFADLVRRVTALEDLISGSTDALTYEEAVAGEPGDRYLDLEQAHADLAAKCDVLNALVEEIRGIVKPSTSKVSLAVKAAIDAWASPAVETESPSVGAPGHVPDRVSAAVDASPTPASANLAAPAEGPPAHDAPVEEWRAYARAVRGVTDFSVIDNMNRSQIRTMLSIEQPVGA